MQHVAQQLKQPCLQNHWALACRMAWSTVSCVLHQAVHEQWPLLASTATTGASAHLACQQPIWLAAQQQQPQQQPWLLQQRSHVRTHAATARSRDRARSKHKHDVGGHQSTARQESQQEEPSLELQQQQQWRQAWVAQRQQQELQLQQSKQAAAAAEVHPRPRSSDVGNKGSGSPREVRAKPPLSPAIDPAVLTKAISSADSLHALQDLLKQHKEQLQQINVCAAFKAVVRLSVGLQRQRGHRDSTAASPVAGNDGYSAGTATTNSSSSSSRMPADHSVALDIMGQLSSRMQQQIRVARPWDLAQAAWACSKLQYRDQALLEMIAQQAQRRAAILLPQDITQLASAYARLGYQQQQLLELLHKQAIAKAADFKAWALVHTAWALHMCGEDATQVLLAAIPQLQQPGQLEQLNALDMSTLLWLMAGHRVRDEGLLLAAAAPLTANIRSYPPAALSQVVLCCAALGYNNKALAAAAAEAVLSALQQLRFNPKQVAHSAFGLSKLGVASSEVMAAAAAAFLTCPDSYSPGLLSMLCWAFVQSGREASESFVQQLMEQCHKQLPRFTADQLASLLGGMLSMPTWHQADGAMILLAAQPHLAKKLPGMSSEVLPKFIISLTKHLKAEQHLQHTATQRPAPQHNSSWDAASTSSSSHEAEKQEQLASSPGFSAEGGVQQKQAQRQQLLLGLLQECVQEWSAPGRLKSVNQQQSKLAAAVKASLLSCGQQQLAQTAQQVLQALETTQHTAGQQLPGSPGSKGGDASGSTGDAQHVDGGQLLAATRGTSASWVDSFVASSD